MLMYTVYSGKSPAHLSTQLQPLNIWGLRLTVTANYTVSKKFPPLNCM